MRFRRTADSPDTPASSTGPGLAPGEFVPNPHPLMAGQETTELPVVTEWTVPPWPSSSEADPGSDEPGAVLGDEGYVVGLDEGDDSGSLPADALLASPPSSVSDDDLAAALTAPPPSPRALRLTRLLTTGLVLALGFLGGVLVNEHWGSTTTPTGGPSAGFGSGQLPTDMPSGMASRFPGGGGQAGNGGQAGSEDQAGSAPTTGEVTLVDGDVIYVTDANGNLVRVDTNDRTTIEATKSADLADIEEGDTVTVTGTTTDDGMTATSVEVTK